MFKLHYSFEAKCHNGAVKTFEREALFADHKTFDLLLRRWTGEPCPNGGVYRYFVTPEQIVRNANVKPFCGPFNPLEVCYTEYGSLC